MIILDLKSFLNNNMDYPPPVVQEVTQHLCHMGVIELIS